MLTFNSVKMKKYKKIVYTLLVLGIVSCTDYLDEIPLSVLSEANLWATEGDGEVAIVGAYEALGNGAWNTMVPGSGWGIGGTDILNKRGGFFDYTMTPANIQTEDVWAGNYAVIGRVNNYIANVPNIDASEEVINSFIAEARFLRALSYFELVQFYGGVPLMTKAITSILDTSGIPRSTEREVWDVILEDLKFAEIHLPKTQALHGRATKWAAKGLLAKSYLTMGGWPINDATMYPLAAEKAFEVISMSAIELNPTSNTEYAAREYGDQFLVSGENSPESLFEIQYVEGDYGSAWGWLALNATGRAAVIFQGEDGYINGSGSAQAGSEFAFSFHDADIRAQWSIGFFTGFGRVGPGRKFAKANQLGPYKYRWETTPAGFFSSSTNAIVLRMADVYLVFAEASNEATGNPNDATYGMSAYDAINEVRNRAKVPDLDDAYITAASPYGDTDMLYNMSLESFSANTTAGRHVYYTGGLKVQFAAAVLQERAWELCFERHRWFDLRRTGKLIDFAQAAKFYTGGRLNTLDPVDKSDFKNALKQDNKKVWLANNITVTDLYMPIPNSEIQFNDGIGQEDQNPGY
jgi:hypothetical protein